MLIPILFLWMLNISHSFFDKFRFRDRSSHAAKRHFVLGAELLAKSISAGDRSAAVKFARSAAEQADKSIAINPKDGAVHILKALALDAQGFTASALEALDVALSPVTAKSLSDEERSDALFKRAEIKAKVSHGGGVASAVEDLVKSVTLKDGNAAAIRLFEMNEEAVTAYLAAVKLEPQSLWLNKL